ncbi:hypothetical protein [Arenimonas donghaensis]|uniref:Uncharacterized protein n=1 Tax=Arenimonas donghaensis DSM 18148 = HO3-R19 TaxID=1121014 RepID=A0A087MHV0_9GAMM|nr:hypothetical protein [Arenimonas donghaensis]KFL36453.1 hypothetical protein N788_12875 [Arenimonas donghaensis DSM 18148 = HO3-R19]
MSLKQRLAAVHEAETHCVERRLQISDTREHLRHELHRSATPTRILVSGVALGFAVGLKEPKGAHQSLAGKVLGGPVFSMVLEAVLPGIVAGITAAAGLQSSEEEDLAEDTSEEEATAEAAALEEAAAEQARAEEAAEQAAVAAAAAKVAKVAKARKAARAKAAKARKADDGQA